MLADFPAVVANKDADPTWTDKEFWDWLDVLLDAHREKYKTLPAHQKASKINA